MFINEDHIYHHNQFVQFSHTRKQSWLVHPWLTHFLYMYLSLSIPVIVRCQLVSMNLGKYFNFGFRDSPLEQIMISWFKSRLANLCYCWCWKWTSFKRLLDSAFDRIVGFVSTLGGMIIKYSLWMWGCVTPYKNH